MSALVEIGVCCGLFDPRANAHLLLVVAAAEKTKFAEQTLLCEEWRVATRGRAKRIRIFLNSRAPWMRFLPESSEILASCKGSLCKINFELHSAAIRVTTTLVTSIKR